MTDLDWGAIHKCAWCGKQQPEPRCIEYNDRMYCGISCKLKQERKDDENLARPLSRAARVYR